MATIEFINIIPSKGVNKEHRAANKIKNEDNYIDVGLVVRDDSGNCIADADLTIEVTRGQKITDQITLKGTGNIIPLVEKGVPHYLNPKKIKTPYYPFHYEFKQSGKHLFTFRSLGAETSIELIVQGSNS